MVTFIGLTELLKNKKYLKRKIDLVDIERLQHITEHKGGCIMGDIIKKFEVVGIKRKIAKCYFDNGSPYSFITDELATELGGKMHLPKPVFFFGLGNGKFKSEEVIHLEIKIKGVYCKHVFYVIKDIIETDILLGHDFFQKFNIKLNPRKRDIIVTKEELKYSQKIRLTMEHG